MAGERSSLSWFLETLLTAVILALFARTFVVQGFQIPSSSMEPNLLVGDHILVNKFIFGPRIWDFEGRYLPQREVRRGDVAVFKYPQDPDRDYVKRCLGRPGDEIAMTNKVVSINGDVLEETGYTFFSDSTVYPRSLYLPEGYRNRDNFGPQSVPAGYVFCLGDNRDASHDSRFWGPVPLSYVKGRAFMIYWSRERPEATKPEEEEAADYGATNGGERGTTRWRRLFRLVR